MWLPSLVNGLVCNLWLYHSRLVAKTFCWLIWFPRSISSCISGVSIVSSVTNILLPVNIIFVTLSVVFGLEDSMRSPVWQNNGRVRITDKYWGGSDPRNAKGDKEKNEADGKNVEDWFAFHVFIYKIWDIFTGGTISIQWPSRNIRALRPIAIMFLIGYLPTQTCTKQYRTTSHDLYVDSLHPFRCPLRPLSWTCQNNIYLPCWKFTSAYWHVRPSVATPAIFHGNVSFRTVRDNELK